MYDLRYYQKDAVTALFKHLRDDKFNAPCIVLPTGAGKTLVMADIANQAVTRWGGRVLILSHVKELLEQTSEKIREYNPALDVGVYSAGLGSRDANNKIVVAGIQSAYKKAFTLGLFNIIMVDEAHLISDNDGTMYGEFLDKARMINPKVRIVGLTATPYRLKTGLICAPENMLNVICYEVGILELIEKGFLCPLVCKATIHKFDDAGLHKRMGDFIESELAERLDTDEAVRGAVSEIIEYTKERSSVIIFCINISHAEHIKNELKRQGQNSVGMVSSLTSKEGRADILKQVKDGSLKYICNVNILSTGFDAPNIDCVVMLRPTASCGLYYQQVGRGFRLSPNKQNCLVMDFAGNVMRLGPVDQLRPEGKDDREPGEAPLKVCEVCREYVAISAKVCPACGFVFPIPEGPKHGAVANLEAILSTDVKTPEPVIELRNVADVYYYPHGKNEKTSLCVEYHCEKDNNPFDLETIREFICFEHGGFAREKAMSWFYNFVKGRDQCPDKTAEVIEYANKFIKPQQIRIKKDHGSKYWSIISYFVDGDRIKL